VAACLPVKLHMHQCSVAFTRLGLFGEQRPLLLMWHSGYSVHA